ncbi:MAG: YCF48-related protein [Acidobacteriota bacterium]
MKFLLVAALAALILGCFLVRQPQAEPTASENWKIVNQDGLTHAIPFILVKFFNKDEGIAVRGLTIQKTNDGGISWNEVYYQEKNGVYAGIFTSENEGWAVGTENLEAPLVLRTDDKGTVWGKVSFEEKTLEELKGKFTYFRDICIGNTDKVWLAGDGGILQAELHGQKLALVSLFRTEQGLDSASCSDSGEVWAIGNKNVVYHYQKDWVEIGLSEKYRFNKIESVGKDVWLIGMDSSDNGVLLTSRDSGRSWENRTPEAGKALNDLLIRDKTAWLVGAEGSIYNSTDGGTSWAKSKSPTKLNLLHILSLDRNNIWISGDQAIILKNLEQ